MRKNKTIITILITLILSFTAAGCGQGEETKAPAGETPPAEAAAEPDAAPEKEAEKEPEIPEEPAEAAPEEAEASEAAGPEESWKTAYLEVIDRWDQDHGNDAEAGYELAFINDDDIPELILFCDDDAWYALDIYTCTDEGAVKMETDEEWEEEPLFTSPGFQGKGDSFVERKGIYFQSRGMMGDQRTSGFRMEGTTFKRIFFYDYSDMSWNEDVSDPYSYILEYTDSAGKDVSVEKTLKEEEDFSDPGSIPEAGDLESEFGFSFGDRIIMLDNKVTSEEIRKQLS